MDVSTVQQKIASNARKHPQVHGLNQHLNEEWLKEAFRRTRKDGAKGVDGKSSADFENNLEGNIRELIDLCKSGKYRAPSARRAYIPKGNGECRPLGIPTFSDKVLQRAVLMLLEPIYEPMFYDCSYGFRPKRSAHGCLRDLRSCLQEFQGGFVLDMDISKYFDSIPRKTLRDIVGQRVGDGVIVRMVNKWLHAGVMENGNVSFSDVGTPQGGVLSPFLANIYLHHVLDEWFHEVVLKHINSQAKLFRFADDFVVICKEKDDAERIFQAMHGRFQKFGLAIHPVKSRLTDFRRSSEGKGGSFDFLGFTFYWGMSRNKKRLVRVKTAGDRFSRTMRRLNILCSEIRHWPIKDQQARLNRALRGHYNYYGVSFNQRGVWTIRYFCTRIWRKWLDRRSQKRHMKWAKFKRILETHQLVYPSRIVELW